MFRGRYAHTIDAKGRVSIPAPYRPEIQEHMDRPPYLTNQPRCLGLYPHEQWLEFEKSLVSMSQVRPEVQLFARFLVSGAVACPIDGHGRIAVPPHLRQHAGLEREVTILGTGPHVEIWNREEGEREIERASERAEDLARTMADLGL
jgi:MraZ protein